MKAEILSRRIEGQLDDCARQLNDAKRDLVEALEHLSRARREVHTSRNSEQRLIAIIDEQVHVLTRDANANELAGCDMVASALREAAERLSENLTRAMKKRGES